MNTAVINLRVEADLKKQAQKVAREMGLSLSGLIQACLKKVVEEQYITLSTKDKSWKEIKVKKYLKEILRWLEEYQPIAKARHEERDRSERDYVQFTEDNRRKQTYKINQISNKRQESWSLYVEAMKDDKNLRERLWTMGNQNGVDLRAT